jgi:Sec-independent protein secretion pathway component TatC
LIAAKTLSYERIEKLRMCQKPPFLRRLLSKNGMRIFRGVLLTTIILTLFGVFFLFFLNAPLVYYFYGYNTALVGQYEGEAITAFKETNRGREIGFYIELVS